MVHAQNNLLLSPISRTSHNLVWFVLPAQECLRPATNNQDVPFQDLGAGVPRLASGRNMGVQAIITSYQFHCCGNVIAWQTYVEPGGDSYEGAYDITFQVWRPSPTVNSDGCYGLVGENAFTSISSPNYISGGRISVPPEPTNRITVQPGDVVGFYAVSRLGSNAGIQLDTSFAGESVWFHRSTDNDPLMSRGRASVCPFPVGSQADRVLRSVTNAAPMLSVGICKQLNYYKISPGLSSSCPHEYMLISKTVYYNSNTLSHLLFW